VCVLSGHQPSRPWPSPDFHTPDQVVNPTRFTRRFLRLLCPSLHLRRFQCTRPVTFPIFQESPCDPCQHVSLGDTGDIGVGALLQDIDPFCRWGRSVTHRVHDGSSAMDKQLSQVTFSVSGNTNRARLSPSGDLPWHQTKPVKSVPCYVRASAVANRCNLNSGNGRTCNGDPFQTPHIRIFGRMGKGLSIKVGNSVVYPANSKVLPDRCEPSSALAPRRHHPSPVSTRAEKPGAQCRCECPVA
jgi:hypothetical protein